MAGAVEPRRSRRRHTRRRAHRQDQSSPEKVRRVPAAHPPPHARGQAYRRPPPLHHPHQHRADRGQARRRSRGDLGSRPVGARPQPRDGAAGPAGSGVHARQAGPLLRGQRPPARQRTGKALPLQPGQRRGVGDLPHQGPPLRRYAAAHAVGLQLRADEPRGHRGDDRRRDARAVLRARQPRPRHFLARGAGGGGRRRRTARSGGNAHHLRPAAGRGRGGRRGRGAHKANRRLHERNLRCHHAPQRSIRGYLLLRR